MLPRRPPRRPRPVDRNEDGSLPEMTYAFERVVSQVRLRYLLDVVSGIYWGTEARLREDGDGGEFFIHDGSGHHDVIVWNEHGLVAGSFDHDNGQPDDCFLLSGCSRSDLEPRRARARADPW